MESRRTRTQVRARPPPAGRPRPSPPPRLESALHSPSLRRLLTLDPAWVVPPGQMPPPQPLCACPLCTRTLGRVLLEAWAGPERGLRASSLLWICGVTSADRRGSQRAPPRLPHPQHTQRGSRCVPSCRHECGLLYPGSQAPCALLSPLDILRCRISMFSLRAAKARKLNPGV